MDKIKWPKALTTYYSEKPQYETGWSAWSQYHLSQKPLIVISKK